MPTIPVFGERHFIKALKKLKFEIYNDRGKGGHKLAKHPTRKPIPDRQVRNITIPHTKHGMYDDPDLRKELIDQVCAFDFTIDEILKALRKK